MKLISAKTNFTRHMKIVAACLALMLAVAAAPTIGSYLEALLAVKVRYIDIQGLDSEPKLDAVNRQLAGLNIEVLTIEEIKAGLEDLSWIHHARIRKIWPDRMSIQFEEQMPLARWTDDHYLNSDGIVFSSEFLNHIDLPYLFGPEGTEQLVMWQFQKLNSVVGVTGQTINSLSLNERGAWSFVLGDISIRLGKEDIMERLRRFLRVYKELEPAGQLKEISSIDTRYPNGVAVNWKRQECQDECYAEINSLKRDIAL
jgi:cell division protein FtsQ